MWFDSGPGRRRSGSSRYVPERDWKLVAAGGEFTPSGDLIGLLRIDRREEGSNGFCAGTFAQVVGEQKDAGLRIVGLPGVEEAVGGGQSVDIIGIHGRGRLGAGGHQRDHSEHNGDQEKRSSK